MTLAAPADAVLGWGASFIAVTALFVLLLPRARALTTRRDLHVAVPLVVLGLFVGVAYRVVTASSVGANIGGSLVLLLGAALTPTLLALSAWGVWLARRQPAKA